MPKDVWDSCLQQEFPYDMLDLANHPTPTDLEKRLGKELTEVFLKTCTPMEKVLFGRDKPLKGPEGKKMWIDPSDRVAGKNVSITEQPSKVDCLKALSHHGILEIGGRVEKLIEERNRDKLEEAVKDAEYVAKFEADLRIKFHVENERRCLNEEWQQRYDELIKHHDEEKKNLIKIFEDGRKVFCEFFAKKCQEEINKHVEEAVANTKQEMENECSERVCEELEKQHTIHQESLEMTLKNLEENDREKMNELCNQCLSAMDVQNNLMMCRQITELMHLMSIEKTHWQKKMNDLKENYETTIKSLESKLKSFIDESFPKNQSSSFILALWKKFYKSLTSTNVNEANDFEKSILNEVHRIQCDLIENYDDNSSRIFLVRNENDNDDDNGEMKQKQQKSQDECLIDDWIYRTEDTQCLNKDSSVAVKWEKQTSSEAFSIEDKFMSSIFHKMSEPDAPANINDSIFSKTASSIIALVKGSKEDNNELLESEVIRIIQKLFIEQQVMSSSMEVVPLPNIDSVRIKDSREFIRKRFTTAGESIESRYHLLGAIDSREILGMRMSLSEDMNLNEQINDSKDVQEDSESLNENSNAENSSLDKKPPYMEAPAYDNCLYQKITDEEWKQLKRLEESFKFNSRRHSSVQFENLSSDLSQNTARQSSILKNQSDTSLHGHELNPNENALHPIQQKCQELMSNMKMESILKLLCSDDVGLSSSSDSQKN